ncbi:DUF6232 family protein [Bosea sp. TAF32]|uniref:DUF6232 family protein n=1 Tax=Bosea sp. TAF32 TaxID=3237482 RepID=UPI003F9057FE
MSHAFPNSKPKKFCACDPSGGGPQRPQRLETPGRLEVVDEAVEEPHTCTKLPLQSSLVAFGGRDVTEEIIYKAGPATVTRTLVRIGGVSYPVNGIGSVRIEPSKAMIFIVLALLAFVFAMSSPDARGVGVGIACVLALFALTARAKLILRTASGDQTALTAMRKRSLTPVMEAIERAVSIRG